MTSIAPPFPFPHRSPPDDAFDPAPGALALLVAATAGFGVFHNKLVKSTPAKDAVVAAPQEVRLGFAERADAGLSSITVVGTDSSKIATGNVKATNDPLSIAVDVTGPMKPGGYLVRWRTSGSDGHVIRGSFPFTVK